MLWGRNWGSGIVAPKNNLIFLKHFTASWNLLEISLISKRELHFATLCTSELSETERKYFGGETGALKQQPLKINSMFLKHFTASWKYEISLISEREFHYATLYTSELSETERRYFGGEPRVLEPYRGAPISCHAWQTSGFWPAWISPDRLATLPRSAPFTPYFTRPPPLARCRIRERSMLSREGRMTGLPRSPLRPQLCVRRTRDLVDGGALKKFGNFKSSYNSIHTKLWDFKSGYIGFLVKFPSFSTPWNLKWDEIDI